MDTGNKEDNDQWQPEHKDPILKDFVEEHSEQYICPVCLPSQLKIAEEILISKIKGKPNCEGCGE